MTVLEALAHEFEREAVTTLKMLALVPADRFDWAPHEKSMKLGLLAVHVAELPEWIGMVLATDGLDFATSPYAPKVFTTTADLLAYAETGIANGKRDLAAGEAADLTAIWTLRQGEMILSQESKLDNLRMSMSQIIHHRAQLGVYLRLLNIPIPGSYGPSADDTGM